MYFYIFIFLYFILLSYYYNKFDQGLKCVAYVLSLVLFVFFFGFKYDVGTDTDNYLYFYNIIANDYIDTGFFDYSFHEIGFRSLNLFSFLTGGGTLLMYVVIAIIIFASMYLSAIVLNLNPYLFILICFPSHIVMMSISGVRQGVAESLIVFAFALLLANKKGFFFVVALATTFHTTAIAFILLFFIKIENKFVLILMPLAAVPVIAVGLSSYGHYFENGMYNQGIFLRMTFLAVLICSAAYLYKCLEERIMIVKMLFFVLLSSFIFLIALGFMSTTMSDRFSYYFILIATLSILYFMKILGREYDGKIMISFIVFVSFISLIIFFVFGNNALPYKYNNYFYEYLRTGTFPLVKGE